MTATEMYSEDSLVPTDEAIKFEQVCRIFIFYEESATVWANWVIYSPAS
jgi:hypothetical protein